MRSSYRTSQKFSGVNLRCFLEEIAIEQVHSAKNVLLQVRRAVGQRAKIGLLASLGFIKCAPKPDGGGE